MIEMLDCFVYLFVGLTRELMRDILHAQSGRK